MTTIATTAATYKTLINADFPDWASDTIYFVLSTSVAISGAAEIFPRGDYTMTLDGDGVATDYALPTPDNTGDTAWTWVITLPDGRQIEASIAYDASDQDLSDILASATTTTDPDVIAAALAGKVSKSGDTMIGDLTMSAASVASADTVGFNTSYTETGSEGTGTLFWDSDEETLSLKTNDDIALQIGQETFFNVKNQTGAAITNGTPVMFAGTVGVSGRILIQKAIADGSLQASYAIGLVTEDIANGDNGKVTWFGKVRGLNTTGTPYGEVWNDGDVLYVSPDTAGYLTNVKPSPPYPAIEIAAVIYAHATQGSLIVRPTWGDGNEYIIVACSDETSDLTTGTAVVTFRMPYAMTLTEVRASVATAPTGSAIQVDINEGGTSVLSTEITIDAGDKTSEDATTPPVIGDSALANDAEITIDIDAVGSSTAGAGLKVIMIGYRS